MPTTSYVLEKKLSLSLRSNNNFHNNITFIVNFLLKSFKYNIYIHQEIDKILVNTPMEPFKYIYTYFHTL